MATTTASNVAKYLIRHFCAQSSPISNLKLQKLLYYCQGWHLGITGQPLFDDVIEAWRHGPVVPSVFYPYRKYRWSPITDSDPPTEILSDSKSLIDEVVGVYGDWTAVDLENLSHNENPWMATRGDLLPTSGSNRPISHSLMKDYFSALAR